MSNGSTIGYWATLLGQPGGLDAAAAMSLSEATLSDLHPALSGAMVELQKAGVEDEVVRDLALAGIRLQELLRGEAGRVRGDRDAAIRGALRDIDQQLRRITPQNLRRAAISVQRALGKTRFGSTEQLRAQMAEALAPPPQPSNLIKIALAAHVTARVFILQSIVRDTEIPSELSQGVEEDSDSNFYFVLTRGVFRNRSNPQFAQRCLWYLIVGAAISPTSYLKQVRKHATGRPQLFTQLHIADLRFLEQIMREVKEGKGTMPRSWRLEVSTPQQVVTNNLKQIELIFTILHESRPDLFLEQK